MPAKALARLKDLGAYAVEGVVEEVDGRRERVVYVRCGDSWKGDDSDFARLNEIAAPGSVDLGFDFRKVSPNALSGLNLRQSLKKLEITHATGPLCEALRSLPPSHELVLKDGRFTPAGCRRLAEFVAGVESLQFEASDPAHAAEGISDVDLARFARLEKIKTLTIDGSQITGAGLKTLSGMKRLEHLRLSRCAELETSDLAGLVPLQSLPRST